MRDGLLQAFKSKPFLSPYRVGRRPGQQGPHRPLRGQQLEKHGTGITTTKMRARSNIFIGKWNLGTLRMAGKKKLEESTHKMNRYRWKNPLMQVGYGHEDTRTLSWLSFSLTDSLLHLSVENYDRCIGRSQRNSKHQRQNNHQLTFCRLN